MSASLKVFEYDPYLDCVRSQIWDRVNSYRWWKAELDKNEGGIKKFAQGYDVFGFTRTTGGYTYREWLPNAKQVFLVGEFNGWQNSTPLKSEGFGRWAVQLPDGPDGSPAVRHRCQLKVRIETNDGAWIDRVPAWTKLAWQDAGTNLFNGVMWDPPKADRYVFKNKRPPKPESLKIYEAHVGMSSMYPKVATYLDFADNVLPRIRGLGYNAVQLMAVSEHAHYGSFGYHVTSFFAPASRSGTPEELKELVDRAHGFGLTVLMDLVHAHMSANSLDGIAMMDGTDHCYTHGGAKGHHEQWDSKLFHYTKHEVLRFLLSNLRWWLEEYQFDGFRFDGVTSMLYHSHGIDKGFSGGYHEYFGPDADMDSHVYLMLANDLIHELVPSAVTVAEDVSGMPTLCLPIVDGGFGFDYRLAMAIPDMLIKILKEQSDEEWDLNYLCHTLTNRRWREKCIGYCESHDQAIVGDKTIAFWLMDQEMYTGMSLIQSPMPSLVIDRGLSLHKILRLFVLGLGGEGYLNFIGNEFGHPEWVDFPRPENEWSYHHCRRRWDLADDGDLRYKFFQLFDEMMHACESRFKWLASGHQYVSLKNQGDRVVAFERGDVLFVMNFHPNQSFENYRIGSIWNEPMRIVLDTDEGRFGGFHRLDAARERCVEVQSEGCDGRPYSVNVYLPARTAQVLVRDSLTQGGIRIWLGKSYMQQHGVETPRELVLGLHCWDEDAGEHYTRNFRFQMTGLATLPRHFFEAAFNVVKQSEDVKLPCATTRDGVWRVYFPGEYTLVAPGFLRNGPPGADEELAAAGGAAADAGAAAPPLSARGLRPAPPAASAHRCPRGHALRVGTPGLDTDFATVACDGCRVAVIAPDPVHRCDICNFDLCARCLAGAAAGAPSSGGAAAAGAPPAGAAAPAAAAQANGGALARWERTRDAAGAANNMAAAAMRRLGSGLHLIGEEELKRVLEDPLPTQAAPGTPAPAPSPCGGGGGSGGTPAAAAAATGFLGEGPRAADAAHVAEAEVKKFLGGDLVSFSESYKVFGLHPPAPGGSNWKFREWLPGAEAVSLVGDFNDWDASRTPLQRSGASDEWFCEVGPPSSSRLVKGSKYRLRVTPKEGEAYEMLPAWCTYCEPQKEVPGMRDALVWPLEDLQRVAPGPAREEGAAERIHECHPGFVGRVGRKAGLREAREVILPRVARDRYTAVLLVGLQEGGPLASTSLSGPSMFVPSPSVGTPEDLKAFVQRAHELGLRVFLSVDHAGVCGAEDALVSHLAQAGAVGPPLFDYAEKEVVRYLLSSLRFFVEEYGIDGFRLHNVDAMVAVEGRGAHGAGASGAPGAPRPAIRYLMLVNSLVRALQARLGGRLTTVAHCPSPNVAGVCGAVADGNLGFDLVQAPSTVPELLARFARAESDQEPSMGDIDRALSACAGVGSTPRVLGCIESSEACVLTRGSLRICMLAWETLHTVAAGGVAPHVAELAAALRSAGHEVHIFTRSTTAQSTEHNHSGVTYHEVASPVHPDFVWQVETFCKSAVSAVHEWEAKNGTFDLVHGHEWLVGPALVEMRKQSGAGSGGARERPLVITLHSTEISRGEGSAQVRGAGDQTSRIRGLEKQACGAANRMVVLSGAVADEVKSLQITDEDKIRVVHNGIHAEAIAGLEWSPERSGETKKSKGIDPLAPTFLFVGRLASHKGPDLLLEAIPFVLQARPDACFIFAGEGHLKKSLEERAGELGVAHAVVFDRGAQSGVEEMKALFKSCDAVMVPSRSEPFGITVLEAWAAGKPVVATNRGASRDVVRPDLDGYVVEPDAGSIAWGVCKLCENLTHAQWMGEQACKRVLQEFSWAHISGKMEQVYYEAAGLQGAPVLRHRSVVGASADASAAVAPMGRLAARLLGPDQDRLALVKKSPDTLDGMALLKLGKMLSVAYAGCGTLTWMGVEFGHLDVLDIPRQGNNFSQERARVPYDVADARGLRFKHLEFFEACLNDCEHRLRWLSSGSRAVLSEDNAAKVLVVARGRCVFAFNFHRSCSHEAFEVQMPFDLNLSRDLAVVCASDEQRFGGEGVDAASDMCKVAGGTLELRLRPRSAVLLADAAAAAECHAGLLRLRSTDAFIDELSATGQ